MSAPWLLCAAAAIAPAVAGLALVFTTARVPVRVRPDTLAWRALVRGADANGLLSGRASVALPGLARDRQVPMSIAATSVETAALGVGVDGAPLEWARLEGGGLAARIPRRGTRGALVDLQARGAPLMVRAIEVSPPQAPWPRVLPALLLPLAVFAILAHRGAGRALPVALMAAACMLLAATPVLDALTASPRAAAFVAPALAAIGAAFVLARGQGTALLRDTVLVAAFVAGAWVRVAFLPSAGSWDTEYWKAWTARADAHGVARVYGDGDAVPAGHFAAQLRGAEPLWLVPYRGRDFVVDYPPLAMALWRWSWRTVTALAPDLDHAEAENAAVKLPALLGDVAGVALLLALFRATPRRALGLAALYWALPVSWLSSGVLGFLDGALAVLVVAACVAAGRGRAVAAGIALALAALIKPTALIVAPAVWCALAARRASPARATGAGAVVVAASLVPFALAGTLQTAIVHVYRILFQGTLSGGFPNPWWLLGHVVTVLRDGAPALGPVRFARLDLLGFPARPIGTLLFAAAALLVWRAQRGRQGATPAVTAGALLVLAYGVCAVGVHENHPHPLFLLLCATGLATARLRLLAAGCALVYVVNMLALSGIGRFYGPRYAVLEPLARAAASFRMAAGFDLTLALVVLQVALFAWALARTPEASSRTAAE
jgi:hypothetical protein